MEVEDEYLFEKRFEYDNLRGTCTLSDRPNWKLENNCESVRKPPPRQFALLK